MVACTLPIDSDPIGFKWVYITKLKNNGLLDKYKARLVEEGYDQMTALIFLRLSLLLSFLKPSGWSSLWYCLIIGISNNLM